MFAAFTVALLALVAVQSTTPPDISGNWQGESWGQVTLTQTAPGEYAGTYTDTVAKEKEPGRISLQWSRIEGRFNGTWREGDSRFGDLSLRFADPEIRGALTIDARSKLNPATPRLADLLWTRAEARAEANPSAGGGVRLAYAQRAAETKPAAPNAIVEGIGWKDVRVGMTREESYKGAGQARQ